MSKLILWNLLSLDGYFEGTKPWDLEWHHIALEENFFRFAAEQLRSAELLVFGRLTYEGMAAHWPTASGEIAELMNRLPKLVFSRSLEHVAWENTSLRKDDPAAALRDVKRRGKANILIFGSANLCATLVPAGLFDEYRFGITSVLLGRGRRLFPEGMDRLALKLLEARPLSPGCVVLRYAPATGAAPGGQ